MWSWHRDGEPSGSIGVRVESPGLVMLEFSVGSETQRQSIKQAISIFRLPCHFGGYRAMFRCPICGRAAALLYVRGSRFACRACQRVAYSSQSEDLMDRAWRKQNKAEAQLGENWKRPRGMRHATYERLLTTIHDCEDVRNLTLCVMIRRLGLS